MPTLSPKTAAMLERKRAATPATAAPNRVAATRPAAITITAIEIPFIDLCVFFVKASIAWIVTGGVITAIALALFGSLLAGLLGLGAAAS